MARNARFHARQLDMFNQAAASAVFVIRAKGSDSMCGLCCNGCKGPAVACIFNANFLPDELTGIISLSDYSNMVAEVKFIAFLSSCPQKSLLRYRFKSCFFVLTCRSTKCCVTRIFQSFRAFLHTSVSHFRLSVSLGIAEAKDYKESNRSSISTMRPLRNADTTGMYRL